MDYCYVVKWIVLCDRKLLIRNTRWHDAFVASLAYLYCASPSYQWRKSAWAEHFSCILQVSKKIQFPTIQTELLFLLKFLVGVLLGCHSLVCWCLPSIFCYFGSQREAWINCKHHCCKYPFAKLNNEKIYLLPYSLCSRIRKLSLFYGCCMHDTNGKIDLI